MTETLATSITDAEIVELFVAPVKANLKSLSQNHEYAKEKADRAAKDLSDAREFIGLTPRAALTKVINDNPAMRDMVALLEAVGGLTNLKARIGAHRLSHDLRSDRMTLTWAQGANRRVALIEPVSDTEPATEPATEYGIISELEIRKITVRDGKACDIWEVRVCTYDARRYHQFTDIPAVVDALKRIFGVNITGEVSPAPTDPEVIEVTIPHTLRGMRHQIEQMLTSMSTIAKVKVQKPKKAPTKSPVAE